MDVETSAPAAIVEAVNISKSFGPVPVLFSVSMDVRPGEVHALIGENGAGKSTLMKILSGFHDPTSGQIRLDDGRSPSPRMAQRKNLALSSSTRSSILAEQMTVEENVFLGREIRSNGFLDRAAMRTAVQGHLDEIGLDIAPGDRISDLTIAQKQMVEIVKAVSRNARILIMDEPTAVLTEEETEVFFRQVEKLKESGVGIVFVSHKLNEVSIAKRFDARRAALATPGAAFFVLWRNESGLARGNQLLPVVKGGWSRPGWALQLSPASMRGIWPHAAVVIRPGGGSAAMRPSASWQARTCPTSRESCSSSGERV